MLTGVLTGIQGSVLVTGGTGQTALGFASSANDTAAGLGADVDVNGAFLLESGVTGVSRVQISGQGTLEIFAAGTPVS